MQDARPDVYLWPALLLPLVPTHTDHPPLGGLPTPTISTTQPGRLGSGTWGRGLGGIPSGPEGRGPRLALHLSLRLGATPARRPCWTMERDRTRGAVPGPFDPPTPSPEDSGLPTPVLTDSGHLLPLTPPLGTTPCNLHPWRLRPPTSVSWTSPPSSSYSRSLGPPVPDPRPEDRPLPRPKDPRFYGVKGSESQDVRTLFSDPG